MIIYKIKDTNVERYMESLYKPLINTKQIICLVKYLETLNKAQCIRYYIKVLLKFTYVKDHNHKLEKLKERRKITWWIVGMYLDGRVKLI